MEVSKLWQELSKVLFRDIDHTFLQDFREPGGANNRLAAWDPFDRTMRFFKFLLFNECKAKPDRFFQLYAAIGDTLVGNPVTIPVARPGTSVNVNIDHFFSIEEYCFLDEHLDLSRVSYVVEIGGGFGRTAQALVTLSKELDSYIIVDLPSVLHLSSLYLERVLSPRNFAKIRFVDALTLEHTSGPVVKQCDLVINIDSFQEMTPDNINFYMSAIVQHSRYFFSKNVVGKYWPKTIGVTVSDRSDLQDLFGLGRSKEVIDIFSNCDLDAARLTHIEAYRPSERFHVVADAPLGIFPYYHNVLYHNSDRER